MSGGESRNFCIGIDFGTRNSSIACLRGGQAISKTNSSGHVVTPSFVAYTEDEEGQELVLTGASAQSFGRNFPQQTACAIKRVIGSAYADLAKPPLKDTVLSWPFKVVNHESTPTVEIKLENMVIHRTPQQVSAELLKALKADAEAFLKAPATEAVISVPGNLRV
ncbi:HSP70-7 [Ramazzottius varieornatus]|uniref:HSP70-7 n=1 Tax=Ramazzottius varieornatus TaxID=947166 RepID=A0A1D1VGX8_RAMVA|nr:HSP70-7 [Ramazzottius varieornatus]